MTQAPDAVGRAATPDNLGRVLVPHRRPRLTRPLLSRFSGHTTRLSASLMVRRQECVHDGQPRAHTLKHEGEDQEVESE